ncbi:MAG: Holliday junction resolvase RuvX [Candidatus Cloacimonetes bacterium]|nr:Holliday junction resolvase RuvX [Candidatus Cloacimonadota bacterium]
MSITRILAIDFGTVRIGIAISDPLRIIARPYRVLANSDSFFDELRTIIARENVGEVVLGLPLNLAGEDTDKTREVRVFEEKLREEISLPVQFFDERYTTVEANSALKKLGYSFREERAVIDMVAASILLQSYMDNQ